MSGVEIVGLLASASQLAFYTINITTSISEIYHRVQDAPKRIQQHAQQIYELIDTARLIEGHRQLQTDSIHAHVNSTLSQAEILFLTLDEVKREYACGPSIRRYWKVLKGSKEKDILASFKRLEQEKSALLLCISIIHTDILENIQNNQNPSNKLLASLMAEPRKAKSSVSETSLAKDDRVKHIDGVSRAEDIIHNEFKRTSATIEHGRTVSKRSSAQSSIHHPPLLLDDRSREQARDTKPRAGSTEDQNRASGSEKSQHRYTDVTSMREASQPNGNAGKCDGSKHVYNKIRATDKSRQINGDVTDPAFFRVFSSEPPNHTR